MKKLLSAALLVLLSFTFLVTVSCDMGSSDSSSNSSDSTDDDDSSSDGTYLTATLSLINTSYTETTDADTGETTTDSDTGHWGIFAWVVDSDGDYVDTLDWYTDYADYGDSSTAGDIWLAEGGDELDGVTSATVEVDPAGYDEDDDTTFVDEEAVDYAVTWDGSNAYGVACDEGDYTIKLLVSRHTHDTPYYTEYHATMTLGGDSSVEGTFELVETNTASDDNTYTDTTLFPYDVLTIDDTELTYTPVSSSSETTAVTYTLTAESDLLMLDDSVTSVVFTLTSDGETVATISATKGSDNWSASQSVTITEGLLVDIYAAAYSSDGSTVLHEASESRFDADGSTDASLTMYLEPVVADYSEIGYTDIAESVTALYVDSTGSVMLAGTETSGLAYTHDGGSNWYFIDSATDGINSNNISALLYEDSTIYLGQSEDEEGNFGGLSVSNDMGSTWTYYDFDYTETETDDDDVETTSEATVDVNDILVTTDGVIYVAADQGLFVSTDSGSTWSNYDENYEGDGTDDTDDERSSDYDLPYSSGKSGYMYNVYTIEEDANGTIWMGCWDGLYTVNYDSSDVIYWTEDATIASVGATEFCYVGEVNGYLVGSSWFGSDTSGIYFYDVASSSWDSSVTSDDGLLSVRNINAHYYDGIWYIIGGDDEHADISGISVEISEDVWGSLSFDDWDADDVSINSSWDNGDGYLWLGTDTGIMKVTLF
ncbi:MAG: hypothetical protein PQJ59_08810 [Spirochaetales bacterium]|nr:hypothetical protein [Spirochaetales bacterium]